MEGWIPGTEFGHRFYPDCVVFMVRQPVDFARLSPDTVVSVQKVVALAEWHCPRCGHRWKHRRDLPDPYECVFCKNPASRRHGVRGG